MNDLARHTPWLHGTVTAYANDGVVLFGLLLVAGFLLARSRRDPRQPARSVLAGVLLAVAVNQPGQPASELQAHGSRTERTPMDRGVAR